MLKAPITHLVRIAELLKLTPEQTVVLPTFITVNAKKVGMTEWSFCNELLVNERLQDYAAATIAKVAIEHADICAEGVR